MMHLRPASARIGRLRSFKVAMSRRLMPAALCALLAASCGGSQSTPAPTTGIPTGSAPAATQSAGSPAPSTTAGPALSPPPEWRAELANVAADGTRSADSALRLFALAFAPLPGVDASPAEGPIHDGTIAVRAIRAHWDELSADQQAAVSAALTPPADAPVIVDQPVSGLAPRIIFAAAPQGLVSAVHDVELNMRDQIAGMLGMTLPGTITSVFDDTANPAYAVTEADFAGGHYNGCTITFYADTIHGEPLEVTNTVAHEVFHCFEAAGGFTDDTTWGNAPDWWVEGGAEWVGDTLGGDDLASVGYWEDYLIKPAVPLFARTYDGEGFFAHLDETGTSPWSVFPAIFRSGNSPAAFLAAGANSDGFLDSWASGVLRQPARGGAWDTTGPSITDDAATPHAITIANSGEQDLAVAPYANDLWSLSSSADVVQFGILGHGRLSDGTVDSTDITSAAYCTRSGGCPPCPAGAPDTSQLPTLNANSVIALTGGQNGASGSITGVSLDTYCQPSPETPQQVWVHVDRPATNTVLAGTILDLVSCEGPLGTWQGVLRLGGIKVAGNTIPFKEVPVEFTVGDSQTVHVTIGPVVVPPVASISTTYDLDVSIDLSALTMSITGNAVSDVASTPVDTALGSDLSALPIEPAPSGRCP
jgi:hypothetical protein